MLGTVALQFGHRLKEWRDSVKHVAQNMCPHLVAVGCRFEDNDSKQIEHVSRVTSPLSDSIVQ